MYRRGTCATDRAINLFAKYSLPLVFTVSAGYDCGPGLHVQSRTAFGAQAKVPTFGQDKRRGFFDAKDTEVVVHEIFAFGVP